MTLKKEIDKRRLQENPEIPHKVEKGSWIVNMNTEKGLQKKFVATLKSKDWKQNPLASFEVERSRDKTTRSRYHRSFNAENMSRWDSSVRMSMTSRMS